MKNFRDYLQEARPVGGFCRDSEPGASEEDALQGRSESDRARRSFMRLRAQLRARRGLTKKARLTLVAAALGAAAPGALAADVTLPSGWSSREGVSVDTAGASMVISSTDTRNVIKWDSFSIGKDASVLFSGSGHKYLNLVSGGRPSNLDGVLLGGLNDVYLVNPAGITMGLNSAAVASSLALITAQPTDEAIEAFRTHGSLELSGLRGQGRVTLLGEINTGSLSVVGSQVIIRDVDKLRSSFLDTPLTNADTANPQIYIKSSVQRIDVGGAAGTDLGTRLAGIGGIVDHTGAKAVSTAEELQQIALNPAGDYFLTNDVDLGALTTTLDAGAGFSGTFDGAYNTLSYTLAYDAAGAAANVGLFSSLQNAEIRNLNLEATVSLTRAGSGSSVGALAGRVNDSLISEVNAFDARLAVYTALSNAEVNAGGLAGILEGQSVLYHVSSSVAQAEAGALAGKTGLTAGMLAGTVGSEVSGLGVVAGLADENLAAVGAGGSWVRSSFADLSEDEQGGLSEGLVFDEAGRLRPVGFFDPYFLPQDQIYDYDGTVKPAYEEQLQSDYFDYASFVNVSREGDYTEILDSGVYRLNFTNASGNPRGWYYVKESDGLTTRSGKGVGLVTVVAPPPVEEPEVELPEPNQPVSPAVPAVNPAPVTIPEVSYGEDLTRAALRLARCDSCAVRGTSLPDELPALAQPAVVLERPALRASLEIAEPEWDDIYRGAPLGLGIEDGLTHTAVRVTARMAEEQRWQEEEKKRRQKQNRS